MYIYSGVYISLRGGILEGAGARPCTKRWAKRGTHADTNHSIDLANMSFNQIIDLTAALFLFK